MWTVNFLMFKLVLEKAEEPEIKLPTPAGSWKRQESSRKTSNSALLTMPKPLPVWITTNYGKFFKRWEYQTTWPASWDTYMQVKKQQLELDMEQQTGSKSGKEYVKAVYCHPAYLTSMQSTSWETLGGRTSTPCRGATKPMHHNCWACALEPGSRNYWSPCAITTECPRALCNKRSHCNRSLCTAPRE